MLPSRRYLPLATSGASLSPLSPDTEHDGLMATLVRGITPEAVAEGLSVAASEATGLAVRVEVKSAPIGDDSLAYGVRPPCRHRPSPAQEVSDGEESSLVRMGRVPTRWWRRSRGRWVPPDAGRRPAWCSQGPIS